MASRTGSTKLYATVSTHLLSQMLVINSMHRLLHRLKANRVPQKVAQFATGQNATLRICGHIFVLKL